MHAAKLSSMLQLCQVVAPAKLLVLPFEVSGLDRWNADSSKCSNKLLLRARSSPLLSPREVAEAAWRLLLLMMQRFWLQQTSAGT